MAVVFLVAAAVAVLVPVSALILMWLRSRAEATLAGGGAELKTVPSDCVDDYIDNEARFILTMRRKYPAPPEKVWAALTRDGAFSWIPFVHGIRYVGDARRTGAMRTADSTFAALVERVVALTAGREIIVSGTRFSIPLLLDSYVTKYSVVQKDSGSELIMTVAARPRDGLTVPLWLISPILRQGGNIGLRGLASRL